MKKSKNKPNVLLALAVSVATGSVSLPVYSIDNGGADNRAAKIPSVIVSAARTEQSTLTTPASITVITRKQIENSGARHVVDVLRAQGGVRISDLFGDGSRASVGMRGFSTTAGSNTLVLVDGRRLNNIDISSPDLNSVSLKDVERIEIVQGSGGVLFGDQAVGGVINIITNGSRGQVGLVELAAGFYDAVGLRAVYGDNATKNIHYRVSAEYRESDNYRRENNKVEYTNLFAKTGYDYSAGNVFAEVQYIKEDLRTPGSLLQSEVDSDRRQTFVDFLGDYTNSETDVVRVGLAHNINENMSFEAETTYRDVEREIQQSFRGFVINTPSILKSKQFELTPRFIAVYPVEDGEVQVTAGIDFIDTDYTSEITSSADKQKMLAEYVQVVVPLQKRLNLTAGFRHAEVEDDVTSTFTNGKQDTDVNVAEIGVTYNVNNNVKLFGRLDQNFRFAKVDELTYVSPGSQLKAQTGDSVEAGIKYSNANLSSKLVVYKLSLEDEIAFDPTAPQPVGAFFAGANVNFDPTTHQGVIVESQYAVGKKINLSGNYTYTDATFDSGVFSGNEISDVPKNSARLDVNYAVNDSINTTWSANLGVVYIGSHYLSGDNANAQDKVSGYSVLDMNLAYRYMAWKFNLKVNNVTNRKYVENANSFGSRFPSPERSFLLTAAWNFR
jgi:iron complex outermembrane receptor protein